MLKMTLSINSILLHLMAILPLTQCFGIPKFLEFGDCANVKVDPDLNIERYSGIWFNIESVPNEYTPIKACSMTNYTWNGEIMTVLERGLNENGKKIKQNSIMHPTEGEEGVLTVDAEGVPEAPYKIVATDYDNYACVYSCMSFMGFRAAFSWIFTRVPEPNTAYVTLCRDLMAEQGIDPNSLQPFKQGAECPYTDKLESVLAYSHSVQSEAKAREDERNKVNVAAVEELKDQVTHSEQTIHELEERIEAGERDLLHTLAVEREREEEEVQELREELAHERRRHIKEQDFNTSSASSANALQFSAGLLLLTVLAFI